LGEDWSATANYEAKPVLQKETKGRFFSGYMMAITTNNSINVKPLRMTYSFT
jgi:hypothetical protein